MGRILRWPGEEADCLQTDVIPIARDSNNEEDEDEGDDEEGEDEQEENEDEPDGYSE
jgi:hypothetical protein